MQKPQVRPKSGACQSVGLSAATAYLCTSTACSAWWAARQFPALAPQRKEGALVGPATSTCGRAGPLAAHAIAALLGHACASGIHDRAHSPGAFARLCLSSANRPELARAVGLVRRTRTLVLQRRKDRINCANSKPDDPAAYGHVPLFGFVASA